MRKLDKHAARATARVERAAPDSKDTATFLRRARAASLKAMGSRFGALAEEVKQNNSLSQQTGSTQVRTGVC